MNEFCNSTRIRCCKRVELPSLQEECSQRFKDYEFYCQQGRKRENHRLWSFKHIKEKIIDFEVSSVEVSCLIDITIKTGTVDLSYWHQSKEFLYW